MPRARGVFAYAGLLLGAWVTLGAENRALAGTSDIVTRVACPALPADLRAEFEARAQVDLTLRSAGGGELEAECTGLRAKIVWRPRNGGTFERDVSAATPPALVDALLFAVAELAGEAASRPPVPSETAAGAARTEPGATDSATTTTPEPPPRDVAEPRPSASAGWAFPFGVVVGGSAALYSTGGSGAAGPSAGFVIGLPARLVLTLEGTYGFGFGAVDPVSVHTVEAKAIVATVFGSGRAYELAAGGLFGSLSATATGPYTPGSDSQIYFGGLVRARYGGMVGGARVSFGPEVRLNLPPTQVVVQNGGASQTFWEISSVTVGFTFDVATSLYGSLW